MSRNQIIGITHEDDGSVREDTRRYSGKVSTGLAPHETSNGAPKSVGYFRMMKEVSETTTVGGVPKTIKKWVLDKKMQKALSDRVNEEQPTKMPFMLFCHKPEDAFSAFMGKFVNNELTCISSGRGTRADEVSYEGDSKIWVERKFDGVTGCPLEQCPDFKSKKCKPHSILKVYPDLGDAYNNFLHPYKFETGSPSSIQSIFSELNKVYQMAMNAHMIEQQVKGIETPFTGLFNIKFYLEIVPFKSNGKNNFAKTLKVHPNSIKSIMEKINLALNSNVELENGQTVDMLTAAAFDLIGNNTGKQIASKTSSESDESPDTFLPEEEAQQISEEFRSDNSGPDEQRAKLDES